MPYPISVVDGKKTCRQCGVEQPVEAFSKRKQNITTGIASYCKDCCAVLGREYRAKHPEKVREHMRRGHLRRNYGITIEQYEEMLQAQNGVCMICGGTCGTGKRLAVDHCHKSGAIRGLQHPAQEV
jgi:hypothetical protein